MPKTRRGRTRANVDAVRAYLAKLGRKGGSSTSDAKAEAARINGRKGGRPPKKEPHA